MQLKRKIIFELDAANNKLKPILENNEWFKVYESLPAIDRRTILKDLTKFYGDSIKECSTLKPDVIHVSGIGTFTLKPYRDIYLRLKAENPTLTNEEVYILLKELAPWNEKQD